VQKYPKSRFTENALLRAGELNYGFENYFEALENFKKLELVADYQNNITIAMNGQLNCNYRLGNYDEAIQSARKLLERGKLESDQILNAHYIMAKSAMATDNLQLATAEFETTVELSDDEQGAEAKYMLASIQFTLQNYQRAEEMVFELANEYPAFEYWKAKGFIMLADIYAAKDNLFQARQTLQSIIDNYPGDDLKTIAIEKLTIIEIREAENNTNANDTTGDGQNR
jgi:TolA-binding protein